MALKKLLPEITSDAPDAPISQLLLVLDKKVMSKMEYI